MIKLVRIDYRLLHGGGFADPSAGYRPYHRRQRQSRGGCLHYDVLTGKPAGVTRTSPPLNRRRKSLTAASWIIKSHGGHGAILRKPRASGKVRELAQLITAVCHRRKGKTIRQGHLSDRRGNRP